MDREKSMDREDAINYLKRKGTIKGKFSDSEEKEISEVQKRGKIYGDPLVEFD
jgi:hypothetical protein